MNFFLNSRTDSFMSPKHLLWFLLLIPVALFSQNTILVEVHNVASKNGNINLAVYDSDETFLKFGEVVMTKSTPAQKGMVSLKLENIPDGEYALAVFHDKNGNDKLDTNWLGIPKEKVAFSKSKMKTFGPPSYRECCFKLMGDKTISITF